MQNNQTKKLQPVSALLLALAAAFLVTACGGGSSAATDTTSTTATPSPTPTPSATPAPAPGATPTPTPTPAPGATPSPTPIPTPVPAPTSVYRLVGSYDKTECVFDSSTGLTWEGKTAGGSRAFSNTFTNYDDSTKLQKGTPGTPSTQTVPTIVEINAATNAMGYVAAVNAVALCGYTNWRMPTYAEFLTINKVANGGLGTNGSGVGIDLDVAAWFPNSNVSAPTWGWSWTSTPDPSQSTGAQMFSYGGNNGHFMMPRQSAFKIRLVR